MYCKDCGGSHIKNGKCQDCGSRRTGRWNHGNSNHRSRKGAPTANDTNRAPVFDMRVWRALEHLALLGEIVAGRELVPPPPLRSMHET